MTCQVPIAMFFQAVGMNLNGIYDTDALHMGTLSLKVQATDSYVLLIAVVEDLLRAAPMPNVQNNGPEDLLPKSYWKTNRLGLSLKLYPNNKPPMA